MLGGIGDFYWDVVLDRTKYNLTGLSGITNGAFELYWCFTDKSNHFLFLLIHLLNVEPNQLNIFPS